MKKLVIVGHGTGGTIIATKMRQILAEREWEITVPWAPSPGSGR